MRPLPVESGNHRAFFGAPPTRPHMPIGSIESGVRPGSAHMRAHLVGSCAPKIDKEKIFCYNLKKNLFFSAQARHKPSFSAELYSHI